MLEIWLLLRDSMLDSLGEDCDRVDWFETYQQKSGNMWNAMREVPNKCGGSCLCISRSIMTRKSGSWIENKGPGKGFKGKLGRLCVNAAVYHIWRVRNLLTFEQQDTRVEQVVDKFVLIVLHLE
ncbi:hypothetical protein LIER_28625 [Lithospermum erythrorhizon]|uniref:Uncharacterized protein n=1 Tax=Lithospermum erythrorhizon TaxID=34254 RepID=A0AAV3RJM2_LITER